MALVELLQKYDFRLEDEGARVKWWWETFQMPVEGTRVLVRRRGCRGGGEEKRRGLWGGLGRHESLGGCGRGVENL